MPADKYGKKLYSAGTVKSEKAAIANRDPARARAAMQAVAREGPTNAGGGRPAVKMPAKQQVISMTKMYKPTPPAKKK